MNKLPREHIVPEPRKIQDVGVGEGAWVSRVSVDHDGNVYLRRSQEVFDSEYEQHALSRHRRVRADRTAVGWIVKIPRDHLPMEPTHGDLLVTICERVVKIEIVD